MIARRGLADFSDPDCTPGIPGCVPHWYCYIPGAATPDCLKSLGVGINEIGQAVGSTVGTTVAAAASGVVQGAGSGLFSNLFGSANCDPSSFWCNYGIWVVLAGGALALVAMSRGGRRR